MWLGQTTGCLTTASPSATNAPKPLLQPCQSTTAGPVGRACAAPAPHMSNLCRLEAGTTLSECVTTAMPAQTACDFLNQDNFSKCPQSSSDDPQKHCESLHCCSKRGGKQLQMAELESALFLCEKTNGLKMLTIIAFRLDHYHLPVKLLLGQLESWTSDLTCGFYNSMHIITAELGLYCSFPPSFFLFGRPCSRLPLLFKSFRKS